MKIKKDILTTELSPKLKLKDKSKETKNKLFNCYSCGLKGCSNCLSYENIRYYK